MGSQWPSAMAASVRSTSINAPPLGLSTRLWGIEWHELLPLTVSDDGVQVRLGDADDALRFAQQHFGSVFGTGSRFFSEQPTEARRNYLEQVCDVFVFEHCGTDIGLFVGNPIDWSAYYIRNTAFVREYQGRAIYRKFLELLFDVLARAGVARVEAETAPSNLQCQTALVRQRFVASGTVLSDRWGALMKFTKYLDPQAQTVFADQFCALSEHHELRSERGQTCQGGVELRGVDRPPETTGGRRGHH